MRTLDPRFLGVALLLGWAQVPVVGQIQQTVSSVNSGGGRSSAGSVVNDGSIGVVGAGDFSSGSVPGGVVSKPGFLGQVTEVVRVDVLGLGDVLPPGAIAQLSSVIRLDDGSILRVPMTEMQWLDDAALPDLEISREGWVQLLGKLSANTSSRVYGEYLGVRGSLDLQWSSSFAPVAHVSPQSTSVRAGDTASFAVQSDGLPPFSFQWFWNGIVITDATNAVLELSRTEVRDSGEYQVRVANAYGVDAAIAALKVIPPEVPASISEIQVTLGGSPDPIHNPVEPVFVDTDSQVVLEVRLTGDESLPLFYQWKLNGENLVDRELPTAPGDLNRRGTLTGATNNVLVLSGITLADAGAYSVTVQNAFGLTNSIPVRLAIAGLGALEPNENDSGAGMSNPGGNPVEFTWLARGSGVATFSTAGSSFDTRLNIRELSTEPRREFADDESGGFHTSLVRFNAREGTSYLVSVEGVGGATGDILLQWSLERTPFQLPEILVPPTSQTVHLLPDGSFPGTGISFTATVRGPPETPYAWLRDGRKISGGRLVGVDDQEVRLDFPQVGPSDVAHYSLRLEGSSELQFVESPPVALEAGTIPGLLSADRLSDIMGDVGDDSVSAPGIRIHVLENVVREHRQPAAGGIAFGGSVNFGVSGAHYFDNTTKTLDVNEPVEHVLDGSSGWLPLNVDARSVLVLDTEGSVDTKNAELDTTLTLRTKSRTTVAENDNSRPGVKFARMTVQLDPKTNYLVRVASAPGSVGTIRLKWSGTITNFAWVTNTATRDGRFRIRHDVNRIQRVLAVQTAANSSSERSDVPFEEDRSDGVQTLVPSKATYTYWIGVETLPDRPVDAGLTVEDCWASGLRVDPIPTGEGQVYQVSWEGSGGRLFQTSALGARWTEVVVPPSESQRYSLPIHIVEQAQYFRLESCP